VLALQADSVYPLYARTEETLALQRQSFRCPTLRIPAPLVCRGNNFWPLNHQTTDFLQPLISEPLSDLAGHEGKIYVAAASTGMGKTQAAYDLGKQMCTIFIWVSPTQDVSLPFRRLQHFWAGASEDRAQQLLDALVMAYLFVGMRIFSHAVKKCQDDMIAHEEHSRVARRVTVAMFRDSRADHCVDQVFNALIGCMDASTADVRELLDVRCLQTLRRDAGMADEKMLVCVDEAQKLLSFETDKPKSKLMLHAFTASLERVRAKAMPFAILLTGTDQSLVDCVHPASDVGGTVEMLGPWTMLTRDRMKRELQHLWSIDDAVFADEKVDAALGRLEGRPYWFGRGVLLQLYDDLQAQKLSKGITRDALLEAMKTGEESVRSYISALYRAWLHQKSVDSVRHELVMYTLQNQGKSWGSGIPSLTGTFVKYGVIPEASVATTQTAWAHCGMEPLSWDMLFAKMLGPELRDAVNATIRESPPHPPARIAPLSMSTLAVFLTNVFNNNGECTLLSMFAGMEVAGLGKCGLWTVSIKSLRYVILASDRLRIFARSLDSRDSTESEDESALLAMTRVRTSLNRSGGVETMFYNKDRGILGPQIVFAARDQEGIEHVVAVYCSSIPYESLHEALDQVSPHSLHLREYRERAQDMVASHPWLLQQWVRVVVCNKAIGDDLRSWISKTAGYGESPIVMAKLRHTSPEKTSKRLRLDEEVRQRL
jgi:hypothetical protein